MLLMPEPGPALLAPAWVPRAAAVVGASATPPKGAVYIGDLGAGTRPYDVVNGVAVISIAGVIVPTYWYIGSPYVTGCNGLRLQLAMAFEDPAVRAIVLLVNSGGGLVSGVADLADWIVEAKAAAGKPVVAILAEFAYSAAYWLASAADSISVPRTGGVGSIGVIMVHWDLSAALQEAGIKATIIAAGDRKADGNAYEPLPGEVRDRWLAECEDIRKLFAASVAQNRAAAGVSLDLDAVLASQARTWEGPSGTAEAVASGFADAVLAPDRAFQALLDTLTT
ncbi:S49 family peptidase [Azospirillum canadense]|uniref:S49 family peptidase n=1 Tax=Azospirillum canadense TaxID=403962 RepID=UPI002226E6CB|nr:S49 family peptidase [Azospirillum canadense]MCW2242797.1 ClpP class serine protease [Azospirillum canadense]